MISVIVPVYNVEKYLDRCIESILQQTYHNLEIILIDDGSTDKSGSICETYLKKDSRIKVYHKHNGGLSDARNYGIQKANGQYLAFVDSDDYIHPQMYEVLYQNLVQTDADIATCAFKKVRDGEDNNFGDIKEVKKKKLSATEAMNETKIVGITVWNKLYKKELFEYVVFPIGKLHEDEFVFHRIIYRCNQIVTIDNAFYYYVQREKSIMNSISEKNIQDAMEAFQDRLRFIEEKQWYTIKDNAIREYMYYLIKKYNYLNKNSFPNKTKWIRVIVLEAKKIQNSISNKEMKQEFRVFCRFPFLYNMYCKLSRMIKNSRKIN